MDYMSPSPLKVITFEEFCSIYEPKKKEVGDFGTLDGHMFSTCGKELQEVISSEPERVWTVLDSDGECIISAGMQRINRMGFVITEKEAPDDFLDVIIDPEAFFKSIKRDGGLRSIASHYELSEGLKEELDILQAKWNRKNRKLPEPKLSSSQSHQKQ